MKGQLSKIVLTGILVTLNVVGFQIQIVEGQSRPVLTPLTFTTNDRAESADARAAYRRALGEYHRGDKLAAIHSLRQAILLNPSFTEAYNSLCVVYDQLKRTEDAIEVCERATLIRSDFLPAFYNLGLVYDAANRRREAIASLKHAIHLNPDYAPAHYHLGRIYDADGAYEQARESLKQAILLKTNYADAHNELGLSFCRSHEFDNSIDSFRQALTLEPGQAGFHSNLGIAYYFAGRYEEAIKSLNQAIHLSPDLQVAYDSLGVVYLNTAQYHQAVKYFQRAIALGKDSIDSRTELYNDLASAYAHLGKYQQASTLLTEALQLKPNFAAAIFNLGVVDLMRRDQPAAFQQYVILKTLDPPLAEKLYARLFGSRIIQVRDSR